MCSSNSLRLQDFRFSRVGGCGWVDVDSRVIAATNRDLKEAMARGEFRVDLYYRVNVLEAALARDHDPSPAALVSGNVRELENVVRRLVVLTDVEREIEALVARGRNGHGPVLQPAAEGLREIARRGAREAERRTLKDASRILKVSYKTLPNKIAHCGLAPPLRRQSADPRPAATCVPMTGSTVPPEPAGITTGVSRDTGS